MPLYFSALDVPLFQLYTVHVYFTDFSNYRHIMKEKNNSKKKLIEYLNSHQNEDLSRSSIISDTGISKSRLSELINSLRSDGYSIITPNRSGMVRMESESKISVEVTAKEIRQWLIILALSIKKESSFIEIISFLMSLVDFVYPDQIDFENNYSDMEILHYLEDNNIQLKDDLCYYLPLPTFRKDLSELCNYGFVIKKKTISGNRKNARTVYCLSDTCPRILQYLLSDQVGKSKKTHQTAHQNTETVNDFLYYSENHKESFPDPLKAFCDKLYSLYDWAPENSRIRLFGKSNQIDDDQLEHIQLLIKYPYMSRQLIINYKGQSKEIQTGLVFYSTETGSFYMLCRNPSSRKIDQLRLDQIVSIETTDKENDFYNCPEIRKIYDEVFSVSYSKTIYHVEVLFQDFGNIKERIERLSSKRAASKVSILDQPIDGIPHTILFQDDIRGLSDFARFLRSFGSSVLVLKPKALQNMMVDTCNLVLSNYEA